MKKISPTAWILIRYACRASVGYFINTSVADPKEVTSIASNFSILSEVFLTLIKMIIAPLVFSTLVVGIAHMGDAAAIGRVFLRP
jgi:Na+/H+-dicarboxylate symporter